MWFEMINTAIAAAGLTLAAMPFFKKSTQVESYVPAMNLICFQYVTNGLRREIGNDYAQHGETT